MVNEKGNDVEENGSGRTGDEDKRLQVEVLDGVDESPHSMISFSKKIGFHLQAYVFYVRCFLFDQLALEFCGRGDLE